MYTKSKYGNGKVLIICGAVEILKQVCKKIESDYSKDILSVAFSKENERVYVLNNGYRILVKKSVDLKIEGHKFEQIIIEKSTPLTLDILHELYKYIVNKSKRKDKIKYLDLKEELNLNYLVKGV